MATGDTHPVDELAARYLDGDLDLAEATAFEHALATPEGAAALRSELWVRSFLRHAGPGTVPAALVVRLTDAVLARVGGADAVPGHHDQPVPAARFSRLRSALAGAGWAVRGPAQAATAPPRAPLRQGVAGALAGLAELRWGIVGVRDGTDAMVAPLVAQVRRPAPPPEPRWRRWLGKVA